MKKMNIMKKIKNVIFIFSLLHLILQEFFLAEIVNACWEVKTNTNVVEHVYFVTLGFFEKKAFKRLQAVMRMCKNIAGDKVTTINAKVIDDIFVKLDNE